jgi:hypothetical protein
VFVSSENLPEPFLLSETQQNEKFHTTMVSLTAFLFRRFGEDSVQWVLVNSNLLPIFLLFLSSREAQLLEVVLVGKRERELGQ